MKKSIKDAMMVKAVELAAHTTNDPAWMGLLGEISDDLSYYPRLEAEDALRFWADGDDPATAAAWCLGWDIIHYHSRAIMRERASEVPEPRFQFDWRSAASCEHLLRPRD
ncbi:MAG: hypothetical protein COV31_01690 [Candidatus Yanofskybacteria bacterium CG10_big_fil_rev_8_21_14_0_10_46_23]|uniref:Uncharacterized protein n=1 Tax=Candidatus Yanofskybacteria bacterium CG10_big_fil_rev_8_21_14_0_10_46_23 TaxID=1975098 RepID=A0A2H0R473_9BACT|nr:MAG: hypothetical protein COV31_01690 [Candidatus Yanofskybacteria bacterium CG10_big_fil_rev_8_21_14_0_10_46_23]